MRLLALTLALAVAILPRASLADAEHPDETSVFSCNKKPGEVAVTFKPDIEVKELITWAMGFTCNKYMYDSRYVQNRHVTVMAPEKMSAHDAYELFLGSLATAGLAVVRKGDAWVIVESQAAKREAVPFVQHPGDGNEVVRFVLRPTYAKPDTLVGAFESLKSDAGEVKQLGSVLVITDYARHVREMVALAKQIDVPGGNDGIFMIPVLHADATKLKAKLDDILGSAAPKPDQPQPKILVDERTNTLIVAGPQAVFDRVHALVDRLDIALDIEGGASIHVYQLGNAIAEEVAKTLNDAIQRQQGAGAAGSQVPKTAASPDSLTLEGQVHVIADPKTNKLIVTASGRDYFAILDVIRQLDEPRRQVYIETVVLTVNTENDLGLGTSSHGAIPTSGGNSLVVGGVETPAVNTLDLQKSLATNGVSGLLGGIVGSALTSSSTFLGTSIPSYAVLFSAMGFNSNSNTVSTPSIIAVDNETTKFHVGQNIPYSKGVVPVSAANPAAGTNMNLDRQDLNFELDIKPHISANDNVMLEITNDSKELGPTADLGPTWNTRGFETRVVVHDQQTIVLSGLTQEHEEVQTTRVPVLGDIPLLGYLFKYKKSKKTKSNVLILLTPYIIKDQLDLQAILERKSREHDEFVASFHALDHMPYIPKVDYRKKRGLVEEINRSVQSVEEESEARMQIHEAARVQPGPVQ
ncbi:MAG: type II secretion system secretin GspD [Deltaproteobacteria bacterium]|nr:type II secretion system secretin GspD [Deltaproteobacteria bacterium]